jgi:hypothetical protein
MDQTIEALARALHDRPDVCGCDEWPCTDGTSAAYWRNDAADLSKLLRAFGVELDPEALALRVIVPFQDHHPLRIETHCECGWRPNIGEPSATHHEHLLLLVAAAFTEVTA